jgi:hypothetical protein
VNVTPCSDVPGGFDELHANPVLDRLLERLEVVLQEAKTGCDGQPLFAVEAELRARLLVSLPGVRFGVQDVRASASEISS